MHLPQVLDDLIALTGTLENIPGAKKIRLIETARMYSCLVSVLDARRWPPNEALYVRQVHVRVWKHR